MFVTSSKIMAAILDFIQIYFTDKARKLKFCYALVYDYTFCCFLVAFFFKKVKKQALWRHISLFQG